MGCIWSNSKTPIPSCYISKNYGYKINSSPSKSQEGFEVNLKRIPTKSLYGDDVENIVFRVDYISDQVLRFQVSCKWDTSIGGLTFADQFLQIATKLPTDKIYGFGENTHSKFKHDMNYVTWPIFARDDFPGTVNTILYFVKKLFIVFTQFGCAKSMVVGLMHHSGGERNLYGVHPFYTCLENDGKSYGVLLMNSNAIDYTMMPAPALTYRTIGGVLDFYIFLGPTPENVIQQYTQMSNILEHTVKFHFNGPDPIFKYDLYSLLNRSEDEFDVYVGLIGRPMIPPYWALGFQLCKYGYGSLDHLKGAVERTRKHKIPQDIQYADIDYMDEYMDFTYDKKKYKDFPEYIRNSSKSSDLRFIIILDPALISNVSTYMPYNTGSAKDVFIKWPKKYVPEEIHNLTGGKNFMLGYVWPKGKSAFPDYFKNDTKTWWINTIVDFHNILPFDGLWIDMNEPTNFGTNQLKSWNWPKGVEPWTLKCPKNPYDDPPYKPSTATELLRLGAISVARSFVPGNQCAVDKTIEETFMKHAKSHAGAGGRGAGVSGILNNYEAYRRWAKTAHERSRYLDVTLQMADMTDEDGKGQKVKEAS
ncbi:Maltase-glucoamylase, intestinal [Nymphon striatum]|nr:Maltase-glucoamylase, intestinal [Nymphon striatum]